MSPEHYVRSTVAAALGWPEARTEGNGPGQLRPDVLPPARVQQWLAALAGGEDLDARCPYGHVSGDLAQAVPDLHEDLVGWGEPPPDRSLPPGEPRVTLARWPQDRSFGLLVSHDIDQIHDREMWRILADINHIRRMVTRGEPGSVSLALRRVGRSVCAPKPATKDYATILELEAKHGFRSTFFVLHDRYWARQGARFGIRCRAIREIARLATAAGCEVTVHGGYYRFNNAEAYRESREELGREFGVAPVGIRNHLLRYSYPGTWRAQSQAGFQYDATYGYNCQPGPRSGLALPFYAYDREQEQVLDLLVLPLTVMDTTVFRYLRMQGEAALALAWSVVKRYADRGGLVTLLWHGNFFNEPEYADWQWVYDRLLERLAPLHPWCAPGAEINRWWRARAAVRLASPVRAGNRWRVSLCAGAAIEGLAVCVQGDAFTVDPTPNVSVRATAGGPVLQLPALGVGEQFEFLLQRRP
jgi:peptidoglycan/xylan/chitin deacetylase (PgdA/CDA1 family)